MSSSRDCRLLLWSSSPQGGISSSWSTLANHHKPHSSRQKRSKGKCNDIPFPLRAQSRNYTHHFSPHPFDQLLSYVAIPSYRRLENAIIMPPPKNQGFPYSGRNEDYCRKPAVSVIKHLFTLFMVAYLNFLLGNHSFLLQPGSLLQLRNGVYDLGLSQTQH